MNIRRNNAALLEELEFIKQKEIERIQQLDLDDIDLISRYNEYWNNKDLSNLEKSKPNPLVPKLDFTKIFEWRAKQNAVDQQEAIRHRIREQLDDDIELSIRGGYGENALNAEHYEEPSSLEDTFKKFYPEGETMNSQNTTTLLRKEELFRKKAEVINELNETYSVDDKDTNSDINVEQSYDPYENQDSSANIAVII